MGEVHKGKVVVDKSCELRVFHFARLEPCLELAGKVRASEVQVRRDLELKAAVSRPELLVE